jgi:hypothetical protein
MWCKVCGVFLMTLMKILNHFLVVFWMVTICVLCWCWTHPWSEYFEFVKEVPLNLFHLLILSFLTCLVGICDKHHLVICYVLPQFAHMGVICGQGGERCLGFSHTKYNWCIHYFMVGCVVFLYVVTNVFIMFNVVFNGDIVLIPLIGTTIYLVPIVGLWEFLDQHFFF